MFCKHDGLVLLLYYILYVFWKGICIVVNFFNVFINVNMDMVGYGIYGYLFDNICMKNVGDFWIEFDEIYTKN